MNNYNNSIEIIKKWYDILWPDGKYNKELEELFKKYPSLPSANINKYKFDTSDEYAGYNFLMCLYFCDELEKKYKQRGIPNTVLLDSLYDIVILTDLHYDSKGFFGIAEINWIRETLMFKLFRIGRLQFMKAPCYTDIPEINVRKDDDILEIHIPSGKPLLECEVINSIKNAKDFFLMYFPEQDYKCFTCYSWLLDDTLNGFLREDSNILKFQRMFKLVCKDESIDVLRHTINMAITEENFTQYKPNNAFTERVMNHLKSGGKFYTSLGYILK